MYIHRCILGLCNFMKKFIALVFLKVGLSSPFKEVGFIHFSGNRLDEKALCFTLKAFFALQIFRSFS